MNVQRIVVALVVLLNLWNGAGAEEVEVVADSAKVKAAEEVITTVAQGERFEVLKREGPWVAVLVTTDAGPRTGWILGNQVRTVAQGVGEDLPAPPAPVIAAMAVNHTQLWESYRHLILFELTLTNGGSRELSYDGAKFTVLADGKPATMVAMERAASSGPGVLMPIQSVPWGYRYVPAPMGPVWSGLRPELTAGEWSVPRRMDAEKKSQLAAGALPPGGKVSGWLAFEVPIPGSPGEFVGASWELSGKVGDHALKLDLSEYERDALEVKVRPATLDDSVPVVEIAGRLNGLNVAEVLEVIDSVTREGKTPVLLRTTPDQIVDAVAARVLVDRIHRSLIMKPTWAVLPRQDQRAAYGETMASLPSENQAAIEALAWRRSNVPRLVAHLTNPAEETRSAAARALGAHTEVEGVVGALLEAASDPDRSVQSAALASLAAVADPRAREAIIAAMDDPKTRYAAVAAAASQKSEAVVSALIKMLDDADPRIVAAACRSLGQQKAAAAIEPLKALQAHPDAQVAQAAIDALKLIGELTPVDAALAKVAVSDFYQQDELNALVRSRDPRAVPALVAALKSGRSARSIAPIAGALGKLGDQAAVEPLLDFMRYNHDVPEEVYRALGELGDPRAVEPLEQALPRSQRFTVQLALIRLGVAGILEQLIERLERAAEPHQKRQIIEALGKAGRNESVAAIEPYLDDPQLHSAAALALLDVGSPEAMAPLAERLRKAEYRYGGELARQLFGLMYLAAPGESEPDESRDRRLEELLREASASENEAVRKAIANEQASIDRRLTERQLDKLRFSLENRRFDLAEEQLKAALERQLDRFAGRSEWQSLTGNWLIEAIVLWYSSGEANRADKLMQAAFATLEARLGADRPKELAALRRQVRTQVAARRISSGLEISDEEIRGLVEDLKAQLAREAEYGPTEGNLMQVAAPARALEDQGRLALAAEIYRTLADLAAEGTAAPSRLWAEVFSGAVRRLELPGNEIAIEGTRLDGTPLDLNDYRGKVVLVEFFFTWHPPCRDELPRMIDAYREYHDRGFEIVAITADPDRKKLEEFIQQEQIPWVTLYETFDTRPQPMARRYGVMSYPTGILVDREGKVVSVRALGDELDRQLEKLFGQAGEDRAER